MEASRKDVEQKIKPVILNLGCGFRKYEGGINVDGFSACKPDVLWDLNKFPYPWEDNSIDRIYAYHVFEHLENWWGTFWECSRILKLGGELEMRVPDITSDSATAYRDHLHVITLFSFDGIANRLRGRALNAWARTQDIPPMVLTRYARVPFADYNWMPKFLLRFCGKHLRNYIWEQRYLFMKIKEEQIGQKFGHPRTEILKKMVKYKSKEKV